ncbi:acyl-CoA dehydrogenase family protein [Chloroflexota bacterium]
MSGFGFSEGQNMLRQVVKDFAQKEIAPGVRDRQKMDLPTLEKELRKIDKKMVDMGWMALNAPEKYGGTPIDHVSIGVIVEELGKVDTSVLGPQPTIAASALLRNLPEEVQDEWFAAIINCDKRMAYGFTEPEAGSDAGSITTRAVRDGDYYIINGEKAPMPGGIFADAISLSATIDPSLGAKGVTMFFVPTDTPGVTATPIPWLGNNHMFPSSVMLDDVRIPAKYREGEEGKGFSLVMGTFDWLRNIIVLQQLGSAMASLEEAMVWAKQRIAFKKPIAKFEGVSFMIAEHVTKVDAARLLCYRALWLRDQGLPHMKETSMAKWFSVQTAIDAINAAMVVHGWYGYSKEHLIESRLRDALGFQYADGPTNIQKLIIARELMGKDAQPY